MWAPLGDRLRKATTHTGQCRPTELAWTQAKALSIGLHPPEAAGLARKLDGAVGVCAEVTASPQICILLGPQDENLLGCRDFVGQLVKTELRSSWLEWP